MTVTALPTTAASIAQAAREEVQKEQMEGAKKRLVAKYRLLADAKKVVANLEGEVKTLEADIAEELGG